MKKLSFYLRLASSLLLVALFASSVNMGQVFRPITPLGWLYIVLIVLLVNLDRILMAYKWNILLAEKGIALPFTEVVRSYYIGTFWGTFLPTSVGGDMVRVYHVSKQAGNVKDIVSSVIVERILGAASALLMGMLGLGLFAAFVGTGHWKGVVEVLFLFLLFFGLVVLSFNTSLAQYIKQRFSFFKQGWIRELAHIYQSYQTYQNHRGSMMRFLIWSFLEQCLPVMCAFFMSQAMNLNVPSWSFFAFIPAILLLSRIPTSLDGFGVTEGLFIYFFSFVGVPSAAAFLLGFLLHIVGIVSVFPGFFYCSFYSPSPR